MSRPGPKVHSVARPDWIHFTLKSADRLEARPTIAFAYHRPRQRGSAPGSGTLAPIVAADHLFRISLLKRFLQGLSQFGYADLGEGDTIFVIVQ